MHTNSASNYSLSLQVEEGCWDSGTTGLSVGPSYSPYVNFSRLLVHLATRKAAQPGNTVAQFSLVDTPTFYLLALQKYTSYNNRTRTG